MKIIIVGGTFDPVHIGHLLLAEQLDYQYPEAEIVFIPAFIPSHKKERRISSVEDRLNMLRLAIRQRPFTIELCEIERGGYSYTIETVFQLKQKYGITEKIGLTIGDDMAITINTWHSPDKLASHCHFLLAPRDDLDISVFPYPYQRVNMPPLVISSTLIRQRVKEGAPINYLVHESVAAYIGQHNLYK